MLGTVRCGRELDEAAAAQHDRPGLRRIGQRRLEDEAAARDVDLTGGECAAVDCRVAGGLAKGVGAADGQNRVWAYAECAGIAGAAIDGEG